MVVASYWGLWQPKQSRRGARCRRCSCGRRRRAAWRGRRRAGRSSVIESRLVPVGVGRLVAGFARRPEAGGRVLRARRGVVLGLVASEAVARRAREDVVLVAGGAWLRAVDADEREDLGVIESRLEPVGVGRLVAGLAGGPEAGGRVFRVGRGVVLGPVTAEAVAGRAGEDVVPVAGGAGLRIVDAEEREDRRVVECRLSPVRVGRLVTGLAGGSESSRRVLRVGRGVVLGLVTAEAVAGRAGVHVGPVTRGAGLGGVDADERKALVRVRRSAPARVGRPMARRAGRRESGGRVVGISRGVVVLLVTGRAVRGSSP